MQIMLLEGFIMLFIIFYFKLHFVAQTSKLVVL